MATEIDIKKVKAETFIQVLCTCPECNACVDILDYSEIKDILMQSLSADNCDIEMPCPECGKQFIVSDISY